MFAGRNTGLISTLVNQTAMYYTITVSPSQRPAGVSEMTWSSTAN